MKATLKYAELNLLFYTFLWLALCALLGVALEIMLAYKSAFLLGPEHETRRLLLRLAHAHGTLLSLFTLCWLTLTAHLNCPSSPSTGRLYFSSALLMSSGFFFSGLQANERDPGFMIALVPLGAAALITAFLLSAKNMRKASLQARKENQN